MNEKSGENLIENIQRISSDAAKIKLLEEKLFESERSRQAIIVNLPGIVYRCLYDHDWTMTFISEGVYDLTGYTAQDLLYNKTLSFSDIILPEYRKYLWDIWMKEGSATKPMDVEYRIMTANQQEKWVREKGILVLDVNGKVEALEGIIIDITEEKKARKSLAESEEKYRTALLSVGDAVMSTNKFGNVLTINRIAEKLTGWKQEEALGKHFAEVFNIVDENTGLSLDSALKNMLKTGEECMEFHNMVLISKYGVKRFIESNIASIKNDQGEMTGVVLVFRDFSEKKEKQERIAYLSYYDQLTGIYNRRFYEKELNRLNNKKNLPLTLVLIDVNGLKLINDAFGHYMGDKALKKIAEIIKNNCREFDITARIGGDEFTMLLPNTSGMEAEIIVYKIKHEIQKEQLEENVLSVSCGFYTKDDMDQDINSVFKKAEDSMYGAKLSESTSMKHCTIDNIIKNLYKKNNREKAHSLRVSQLCMKTGEALGLSDGIINELRIAGLMHDIGKIAIKDMILNKNTRFDEIEWLEMKRHPEIGYNILRSLSEYGVIAEYVLCHHERWDGTGYPRGLKGEEIPLLARIVALSDAYAAMTGFRMYRESMNIMDAIHEININIGTQFDPELAELFIEIVKNNGYILYSNT